MVAREQDAAERAAWRSAIADLDPAELIFLDETSTPTTLTPLYARAPRGTRAVGRVPRGRWQSVTFVGTLTLNGWGGPRFLRRSARSTGLDAFVDQFLVPTLRPGQTVILDNLSVHKSAHAKQAIEAAGCHLLPLPRYSPDFNPIEQAYAKFKQLVRKRNPRTFADVVSATAEAMALITPHDARGFFIDAGYRPRDQN
ncbi:MAG: IS630 family transposase [Thermomicrobiales bacterium]